MMRRWTRSGCILESVFGILDLALVIRGFGLGDILGDQIHCSFWMGGT